MISRWEKDRNLLNTICFQCFDSRALERSTEFYDFVVLTFSNSSYRHSRDIYILLQRNSLSTQNKKRSIDDRVILI